MKNKVVCEGVLKKLHEGCKACDNHIDPHTYSNDCFQYYCDIIGENVTCIHFEDKYEVVETIKHTDSKNVITYEYILKNA